MKIKIFSLLLLFSYVHAAEAQLLTPVDDGSSVKFKIKNFGLLVDGTFNGLQGKIQFDPANISSAQFDVSIDANSIDTGIGMRDNHLRKQEYFDVKLYPHIRFVSSKITPIENGEWIITGMLIIKSVTKEISFPFSHAVVNGNLIFIGEFQINRRDFNVGRGSFSLADNFTVHLRIATIR